MERLHSLLGFLVLAGIAWVISEDRRRVNYRAVGSGLVLQVLLCLVLLKVPVCRQVFFLLSRAVMAVDRATTAGTSFVFGFLGGAELPYEESFPGASIVFACKGLPLVLVVSALTSLLFYWRV